MREHIRTESVTRDSILKKIKLSTAQSHTHQRSHNAKDFQTVPESFNLTINATLGQFLLYIQLFYSAVIPSLHAALFRPSPSPPTFHTPLHTFY